MTLVICITTYNRNLSLIRCLKSINNLYVVPNVKIKIIVVDNSIGCISFKPVKNSDLWKELDNIQKKHLIDWRWVRGHSGHEENERVDKIARTEAERVYRN